MLVLLKMSDNSKQQRHGRTNGAIRSIADRRPMGADPSLASESPQIATWRAATGEPSQSSRRHSLDFAEWRSLARPARGISFTSNLLATTSRLGKAGRLAHHLTRIPGRTKRARAIELERIVSRWQFRPSEKRGSKVGKTKRGKGTKWMVVVDGEGVPLGKQLYSASPNEVRLAEETLAAVRVRRRTRAGRPREKAQRVIADRAYDGDPLRERLAAHRRVRMEGWRQRRLGGSERSKSVRYLPGPCGTQRGTTSQV